MFTGIIRNRATVLQKSEMGGQIRFAFKLKHPEKGFEPGESLAVNGVCLTVTRIKYPFFHVDVVRETLRDTTLKYLNKGDVVNLERSLRFGNLVGGHFVFGHVDGVGSVQKIVRNGKNQLWTIQAPPSVIPYLAVKGSIAVDGISLTIQNLSKQNFQAALIPHTLRETALVKKREGDRVNLEVDMLARYAKCFALERPGQKSKPLRIPRLLKQGF